MSDRDPAAARFAAIQVTRLMGAACVIAGMLVVARRLLPELPEWAGYVLIAIGLVDTFVIPPILIRKWRSPK
ncbi:hypothetical protein SAMN05518801_106133 [Novosphingobium sp. CF614]|uniref:hypothetical protein n=1 Tax=Novosphingobium sp. CF614 TaxID=1884364 RepID=UPI0008E6DF7E|nr:hypothetical protein [Novosphingobium sp. CF614]SFG05062.1 hypothetical protein SAMN05518801_106133 [Novosphingobium sp. CF614]